MYVICVSLLLSEIQAGLLSGYICLLKLDEYGLLFVCARYGSVWYNYILGFHHSLVKAEAVGLILKRLYIGKLCTK